MPDYLDPETLRARYKEMLSANDMPGGVQNPNVRPGAPSAEAQDWLRRSAGTGPAPAGQPPGAASGRAYEVGKVLGRYARGAARFAPQVGGGLAVASGLSDLAERGPTAENAIVTGLGAASFYNPYAAAPLVGMAASRLIPENVHNYWLDKFGLTKADQSAGPALKQTLAGRTPAEYLAQRQAATAPPASQADVRRTEPPEGLPNLRPIQGGRGPISRAARAAPVAAAPGEPSEPVAYEGAAGPRFVVAGGGQPGFQVINRDMSQTQYPDIRSSENLPEDARAVVRGGAYNPSDTTQVINQVGPQGYGGYIQHYANQGYQVPVTPGQSPVEAEQGYNARALTNQRIHAKQAAGQGLTDQDVLDYSVANNLDPKNAEAALTQRYQSAEQAGAHIRGYELSGEAQRDVAKIQGEAAKNRYVPMDVDTGQVDVMGQPIYKKGQLDTATGKMVGGASEKANPTPSPKSIEELRNNAKNSAVVQEFEARYGLGSAARYLQTEKPKGYKKGGLIRRYAKGGRVDDENDYRADDTPEDYALRTRGKTPRGTGFGGPIASFSADPAFGTHSGNFDADPGFAGYSGNFNADPAFGRAGDEYFARGGAVRGPGSGTSDSIPALIDGKRPARISDGEYVIPAAVVKRKGKQFFDDLIAEQ